MESEKIEYLELIATRVPPGDQWVLVGDKNKLTLKSLTDALEVWFGLTQEKAEFRLAPLDGKLYVIRTEDKIPDSPKRFNIYGDY